MEQIIGFDQLKVGQRVKVKGKIDQDGAFKAIEVSVQPALDEAAMVGIIQNIDRKRRCLSVLSKEILLADGVEVRSLQRNSVTLQELQVGGLVKIKGGYSLDKGFVPRLIRMKQTLGFNIDKLKGNIDEIDRERRILNVIGFTVKLDHKTIIEGY